MLPAGSCGASSARRFCPVCAASDVVAAVDVSAGAAALFGDDASAEIDAGSFERFASDLSSRGVARSGGGAGAEDGGLVFFTGCTGALLYDTGAVKYAGSAWGCHVERRGDGRRPVRYATLIKQDLDLAFSTILRQISSLLSRVGALPRTNRDAFERVKATFIRRTSTSGSAMETERWTR